MKKSWKIVSGISLISAISLITIPSIISCTSSNTTSNGDKTTSTSSSVKLNANHALNNNSNVANGTLSNLNVSWNNTINGAVNVNMQNATISLNGNVAKNSTFKWYITNNSDALVTNSVLLAQTNINSTTIPDVYLNHMQDFVYYVFCIISNNNATYSVQSPTTSLNLVGTNTINITNGLINNAICVNTTITFQLNTSLTNVTYSWNEVTSSGTVSLNNTTNSLDYPTHNIGYRTINCIISKDGVVVDTVLYTFYVNPWANLTITNANLINNVLTITNNSQSLSYSLTNSLIPATSHVTFQWYKKGLDETTYNTNLMFAATNNTSTTFALNDLVPTYTYDFKVIATFTYNTNVYTIESNIVHVYYNSNIGSVSINTKNGSASSYTINNGQSLTLLANTNEINSSDLPYLQYQWQTLINGNWTNITNATSNTYTLTEKNSAINQIRVSVSLPQNWNTGTIYSNTITIQAPAISEALQKEIYTQAVNYFANSSDFSNMWISYFTNSNNSNYWWFWQTLTSGWWKCGGHFAYKNSSGDYVAINDTNVLSYLKIASVSLINGSFSDGDFTDNPRLVFNMQPLTNNVYIDASTGAINLPANETFAFSSPIYVANTSGYANNYNFSVASNGSFTYSINVYGINNSNQTDMKYYWNSSANSAWGLNFNSSILESLKSDGFFGYQTTNSYTVLYNWLNNPTNAIYINNSTTPALPNFYNQVLNKDLSIDVNPSQESSSSKLITFNYGTMTLSVNPALSNNASATFSYTWQSQVSGSIEWTNLNNTTNSYTLTYPKVSLTKDELILYKVTITTDYGDQSYTATETFYVDWLPSDAATITN